MRTLLISDVHGQYDAFIELLALANFDENKDRLIILGDIIDRGPKSYDMIEWVSTHDVEVVMGNHEHALLGFMAGQCYISNYLDDFVGGKKTLDNYKYRSENDLIRHLTKLRSFPIFIELKDHILVHAGLDVNKSMINQSIDELLWGKTKFQDTVGYKDKIVVFGHYPTDILFKEKALTKDSRIWRDPIYKNKIGIDCGNYNSKKLACLDLYNNIEYYYSVYSGKKEVINND